MEIVRREIRFNRGSVLLQNWAIEEYVYDSFQCFTASATARVSILIDSVAEIVQVSVS